MSKIIALVSKHNVDLTPAISKLTKTLPCVIIDTLYNSYTTHLRMNTSVMAIDPMSGPENTNFKSFRSGIRDAKKYVDSMSKMVILHETNTHLMGSSWTNKCIPTPDNNKYTILLGLYTKEDVSRVVQLGGTIIVVHEENPNYKYFATRENEIETFISQFKNTYRLLLSDQDFVSNVKAVVCV